MMDFWVRADGQDQWQAVPHEGGILVPGLYTVIARSPQPHFTITVDIHHLQDGDPSPIQPSTGGVSPTLQERRSIRTNDEGVGVILPNHALTPGIWEFHCHDADLIAELFGDARSDVLRLSVPGDPNLRTAPEADQDSEGETPEMTEINRDDPEASSQRGEWPKPNQVEQPASTDPFDDVDDTWDLDQLNALAQRNAGVPSDPPQAPAALGLEPVPFTLLHSQLQGDPGEVVVLTGRIGGPGDMEARVYAGGEVVYESQRTIQFPPEARTAVFSLPIPLPATPWPQNLVGTLMLQPTSAQLPTSVSFTIARRTPPSPEPEVDPMVSPLARANRNSLSDPLSSRSAQSAPLHLGREAAPYLSGLTADSAEAPPPVVSYPDPNPMPQTAQPSDILQSNILQVEDTNPRTLKRLLRFCQSTSNEPTSNKIDEIAADKTTAHETVDPPQLTSPEIQSPEIQSLEPAAPDPTPDPPPADLSKLEQSWPVAQELQPRVESVPGLPTPEAKAAPAQHRQDKREKKAVAMDPRPLPVMHPFQEVASESLPKPDLEVPLHIRAGETFDIKLRITCEAPPPWIKFRIRNGQNKSIADGPRCLIDYSQTGDNSWQTLTRLTIPHGIPELWFEAWVVSRDLSNEGSRVVVQRTVRE